MVRRVVTGVDDDGKPLIVADGEPPRTYNSKETPQMANALVWATECPARSGADPTSARASYLPSAGGTVAIMTTLPPASVYADPSFDPERAALESLEGCPGLAEAFEPDNPGFHTTQTVDYAVVLDGQLVLDLDGGVTTVLHPGDIVVQNGTRHAFRNESDSPATFFAVLISSEEA